MISHTGLDGQVSPRMPGWVLTSSSVSAALQHSTVATFDFEPVARLGKIRFLYIAAVRVQRSELQLPAHSVESSVLRSKRREVLGD